MLRISICAGALALMCGAALAEDVTITNRQVTPNGVVVNQHSVDTNGPGATDSVQKSVTHDSNGCVSESVKKTNGEGDSATHTQTNC